MITACCCSELVVCEKKAATHAHTHAHTHFKPQSKESPLKIEYWAEERKREWKMAKCNVTLSVLTDIWKKASSILGSVLTMQIRLVEVCQRGEEESGQQEKEGKCVQPDIQTEWHFHSGSIHYSGYSAPVLTSFCRPRDLNPANHNWLSCPPAVMQFSVHMVATLASLQCYC